MASHFLHDIASTVHVVVPASSKKNLTLCFVALKIYPCGIQQLAIYILHADTVPVNML